MRKVIKNQPAPPVGGRIDFDKELLKILN